jgi:hypothetical protein
MNLLEHEFATVQTGDRRFHKRSGAAAPSSPGLVTCCGQAGFHSPRRDLLPASSDGKSITPSSNTSILIQLATRVLWCDYGRQVVPELARPAALIALRGHGDSSEPLDATACHPINCSWDVIAVLDRAGIGGAVIFGYGFGGRCSLYRRLGLRPGSCGVQQALILMWNGQGLLSSPGIAERCC